MTETHKPGDVVRIIDGPYDSFSGVVASVDYEKSKLRVTMQIRGRPATFEVEVGFGQVEK